MAGRSSEIDLPDRQHIIDVGEIEAENGSCNSSTEPSEPADDILDIPDDPLDPSQFVRKGIIAVLGESYIPEAGKLIFIIL